MANDTHVYTSITSNYLPKARVLAESVKRVDASIIFHLVLSDALPVGFELADEPFDNVILAQELVTEGFHRWAFCHSVVELCTAVKGPALEYLFTAHGADKVFYFDPDMVVFSRLDELIERLQKTSIVLTPHLTDPDPTELGVLDSEIASLLHGVFNLGFIGVRNTREGRRFSNWWAQRLLQYCHDDLPRGLFTDQKWVNLAPCFFDEVTVLRSPAFNVATWNLATRSATGSLETGIEINGEPLGFYHFSGFDSGDQITMLERYGAGSPVLYTLREWYIQQCELNGQSAMGTLPAKYDFYNDGLKIERAERLLYRQRVDLQQAFPNPYDAKGPGSFQAWYQANPNDHLLAGAVTVAPGTSISEVFADLARYFNGTLVHGQSRGRVKRLLLRSWVKTLQLASRIAS